MNKMLAVYFDEHGGTEKLRHGYVNRPRPGRREVLIKVRACALNHLDLWMLLGMRSVKIPLPHIPGCDVAGEVVECGPRTRGVPKNKLVVASPGICPRKSPYFRTDWDSRDPHYEILGLQSNGGFAEYVKVPAANVLPVSSAWSPEEWASVPLVFITAWHMLVTQAQLKKKEKVLIHAAGSGVGSAAIQIAKHLGATVITTVGRPEKIAKAKALGADHVIPYQEKDFREEVFKITHGQGVEVALDHIGPATFAHSLACLQRKGRLVTCGVTSGPTVSFDLRLVFSRQLSILGCYMGGFAEFKKVIALVKRKVLKPVVDKVYNLREAPEAFRRMESRDHFGKIVLKI
ncbi:MAG: zinc-binding dehydrogenase [Candidatus Omnitrophota bacterium]